MTRLVMLCLALVWAVPVSAQTVTADRFRLATGPCVERSGSGTPEGAITGNVCDTWHRTDTGQIYFKISGTASTTLWVTWTNAATNSALVSRDGAGGFSMAALVATSGAFSTTLNVTGGSTLAALAATTGTFSSSISATAATFSAHLTGNTATFSSAVEATDFTASSGNVGTTSYVSQTTGWRCTFLGACDSRYLFVDEMHAKSFIADLEQALAGGQIISKSVAMVSSFTCPAAGAQNPLFIRDLPSAANMAAFEANDYVVLRTFSRAAGSLTIGDCVGVVSGYTDLSGASEGTQSWLFDRVAGAGGGTMSASTAIAADSLAIDYGVSGNGYYEVNAIDGAYGVNSPYAQIVTWATSPIAANRTVRARYGNLKGITSVAEYGLWAGKSLSGNQYLLASDTNFELRGIDLKLYDGATNTVRINPTVPSFAMGSTLPSAYGTGTGIWMGKDIAYKFRVGDPAGNRLAWDNTDLTLVSQNLSIGAAGVSIASTTAFNSTRGYTFTSSGWSESGVYAFENGAQRVLGLRITGTGASNQYSVALTSTQTTNGFAAAIQVVADTTPHIDVSGDTTISGDVVIDDGAIVGAGGGNLSVFGDATVGANKTFTVRRFGLASDTDYAVTRQFYSGFDYIIQSIVGGSGTAGDFYIAQTAGQKLVLGGGATSLRFSAYGAGTLSTDASGNVTASSDERMKDVVGPFAPGLNAILGVRPILYRWKTSVPMDAANIYAGFSAQNVRGFVPEAVGQLEDGMYSLSIVPLTAAVVTAVQELAGEVDELRAALKLPAKDRAMMPVVGDGRIIKSGRVR